MRNNDPRPAPAMERRAALRFAIGQELVYKILDHRAATPESGVGRTLDISSGGVRFETVQRLHPGKRVELSVNWPAQLDDGCPLKFVALGRVVRAEDTWAAMHIEQYEFRTRRNKELPQIEPEKPSRSRVSYY
ncbi:MAG TPA: PilZ domain-containing protein [Bryobacteraceae bacterium]|nr:PilZ domain-containing protein [Bryobacteraceae bacterium]